MKITTADGMVFEGTLAEYTEFLAFAESKVAEGDSPAITFEGAEYRKVDREAREGDVVVLTGDNLPEWFTKGKAYKVNGFKYITEDNGANDNYDVYSKDYGRTRETVDVYEPVAKAEPTPSKPKLKAGDFVTVNSVVYTDGFTPGKIYEVHANTSGIFVLDDDGDERRCVLQDGDYEIVDAETAKWAKLGRKVGEFRKGDIVRIVGSCGSGFEVGSLGTVAEDGIEVDLTPRVTDYATDERAVKTYWAKVELIAPAEAVLA